MTHVSLEWVLFIPDGDLVMSAKSDLVKVEADLIYMPAKDFPESVGISVGFFPDITSKLPHVYWTGHEIMKLSWE